VTRRVEIVDDVVVTKQGQAASWLWVVAVTRSKRFEALMRTVVLAAVVMAIGMPYPAEAQTLRCDALGTMQTCRGPDGYSSTENRFGGGFTVGRDSLGNQWRTQTFGSQSTTTFQPGDQQRGW
jgi:hypothetical protein